VFITPGINEEVNNPPGGQIILLKNWPQFTYECTNAEDYQEQRQLAQDNAHWPGLPSFYWYNVPKWGKIYQMTSELPNPHKIYQITRMYNNIFHSKVLQNKPKLGFLVSKETIWQPWHWQRRREIE
jgi:hypothetical protein